MKIIIPHFFFRRNNIFGTNKNKITFGTIEIIDIELLVRYDPHRVDANFTFFFNHSIPRKILSYIVSQSTLGRSSTYIFKRFWQDKLTKFQFRFRLDLEDILSQVEFNYYELISSYAGTFRFLIFFITKSKCLNTFSLLYPCQ